MARWLEQMVLLFILFHMNNSRNIFFCILVILFQSAIVTAQWWEELLPYGDMDQWGGRYITDSKLIGGGLKLLYAIGSNDTIRENAPYIPQDNNPCTL